jgi:hypothetical protein
MLTSKKKIYNYCHWAQLPHCQEVWYSASKQNTSTGMTYTPGWQPLYSRLPNREYVFGSKGSQPGVKEDFYSRLVIPTGSKESAGPWPGRHLYSRLVPTGSKSLFFFFFFISIHNLFWF